MIKNELNVNIKRDSLTNLFIGNILEFPEAIAQGSNINELLEHLKAGLSLLVESKKVDLDITTNIDNIVFKINQI